MEIKILKSNLENYKFLVQVYDQDFQGKDFIGQIDIAMEKILKTSNKTISIIYDLYNKQGKNIENAKIEIEFKFINH